MNFHYTRTYAGPVQAVIFDWAGTTVDFGSLAPIKAFCQLFEQEGVAITQEEAREPMGTEKREHIKRLLAIPRIKQAWQAHKGNYPSDADIDRLYEDFVPIQKAMIATCAKLVPGANACFEYLNNKQIKIGANTGYSKDMVNELIETAAQQGYRPESNVCATEVPKGRPYPHMTFKNMLDLEVEAVQAVVKVDDTLTGIEEGLNAGCWTVGVAVSGNEVGLSWEQWSSLSVQAQTELKRKAYTRFRQCGAHFVIDSIAQLPEVIDAIESKMAEGIQP